MGTWFYHAGMYNVCRPFTGEVLYWTGLLKFMGDKPFGAKHEILLTGNPGQQPASPPVSSLTKQHQEDGRPFLYFE
jgi:hypothetical protein